MSDKENMQRLEGGFLGDVEACELKGFVQDVSRFSSWEIILNIWKCKVFSNLISMKLSLIILHCNYYVWFVSFSDEKSDILQLRKRGIAHDGPDGIHIPALETMGEPAEEDDAIISGNDAAVSEADTIFKEAASRAAFARKIG